MTNKRTPRQGNHCPDCTDHEHRDAPGYGNRSKSDSTIWWIIGALLLAGGGGAAAAGASSTGTHPAPTDTVCTQYYKGGC